MKSVRHFLLMLMIAIPGWAQSQEPMLGQGDVLLLRALGQPDLSAAWPVGPNGTLDLPGLGKIDGITDLTSARQRIEAVMKERLGLTSVAISVSVQSWRPVIVGGAVARPGDVPFRPEMRLIEAVIHAGGIGGGLYGADLGQTILINQESERLLQAQQRLARLIARQTRLRAELDGGPFDVLPESVTNLVGAEQAALLFERESDAVRIRAETRNLALRRIDASLQISADDIEAQQAISSSLGTQLNLVRENLQKLQPLFDNGTMTGARMLELRRDFVDIEGRVGEARARLAQAQTGQGILSEEKDAYDLQIRLEIVNELIGTQFEMLDAESSVDLISATLQSAGVPGVTAGYRNGDCRAVILRMTGQDSQPKVMNADALTALLPGDVIQVGRATRNCPEFLDLSVGVSP